MSKPFSLASLSMALARRLPAGEPLNEEPGPQQALASAAPDRARVPARAAASIDTAVIDTLFDLDESGGPSLLREVFTRFLQSADQRLLQMQTALADNEAQALRKAAHAMKSSAFNVGASALARQYGALERCANEHQLHRAGEWLELARHEQACVKVALEDILREVA